MTLSELKAGAKAQVTSVGGERSFRRRLLELGLVPGTTVEMMRQTALGDLVELRARGSHLSIRRSEAREVRIEELGPDR